MNISTMRAWTAMSDAERAVVSDEMETLIAGLSPDERVALNYRWDFWRRPSQIRPAGGHRFWNIKAGRGWGKLLAVDTLIKVRGGWKQNGDIVAGDQVYDENGNLTTVLEAHPPEFPERMYCLTFSDGSTILAGGEHQWVTWTHAERKAYNRQDRLVVNDSTKLPDDWATWNNRFSGVEPKTRTTDEIVATFTYGKRGDLNHSIPLARPFKGTEQNFRISPYLLGIWLGDGDTKDSAITQHRDDAHIIKQAIRGSGYEFRVTADARNPSTLRIHARGMNPDLRAINVLKNKHIPHAYLEASVEQRKQLLAGLMDTDGSPSGGHTEFCTTLPIMAEQFMELARGLGEKPVCKQSPGMITYPDGSRERKKDRYRITWRPTFNPFALERKAQKFTPLASQGSRNLHRMIVKCEKIAPVLSRCLTVDSPNSMYLAGLAMIPTHNTRVGAEETRAAIERVQRIALVGPTTQDIRKVMIEGESGLLSVFPPDQRPLYEPSKVQVTFHNGAIAGLYTAEEPDRLRGPQHEWAWIDEPASFHHGKAVLDNLRLGLRLGRKPWGLLTGTPKPAKWLRDFAAKPEVVTTGGALYENINNLAESFIEDILGAFEGTRLGRQEVHGEDLDDVEGALWEEQILDRNRFATFDRADPLASINGWLVDQGRKPIERTNVWRTIVAVDPPGETAECGIIVATAPTQGRSGIDHAVILEDASLAGPPERWGKQVASAARRWNAERVFVESNQGGDMTRATIHAVDPGLRVEKITAKISKGARAEPISALYERGLIHHAGFFPLLESQMVTWVPNEGKSPDRLDALVHAVASLLVAHPTSRSTITSAVNRRI